MRAAASEVRRPAPRIDVAACSRTLPSLLDEAVRRNPNPRALNELTAEGPRTLSTAGLRDAAHETALGLRQLGLARGDRVGLLCPGGIDFAVFDMGCLSAGLVDVPVHDSYPRELVVHALRSTEARALFVRDAASFLRAAECAEELPHLQHVVVADAAATAVPLPRGIGAISLGELRARGRRALAAEPGAAAAMLAEIAPGDVATVIFTSGTTGPPKGVMLTHAGIVFDALAAFAVLTSFRHGPAETALSILPFAHGYARTVHYGYLHRGTTVHFAPPDRLMARLREVRPTIVVAVPRVLEKVVQKFVGAGAALRGPRRRAFDWAVRVAAGFDVARPARGPRLRVADALVLRRWRRASGGRLRHVVSGGASLAPHVVSVLGAAGIPVYQGYGLTEAGPIVTCQRRGDVRAGTVGPPLPGVEVAIAADGEVLTRGPHVMHGYWRDPEATHAAIDDAGWLHTGDVGRLTEQGHLVLTDRKSDVFKLSTGEFVAPRPIEEALQRTPLVDWAYVFGEGRSSCAALVFPSISAAKTLAQARGAETDDAAAIAKDAAVAARIQEAVAAVNARLPRWSAVRAFRVVPVVPSVENGLLSMTFKLRRDRVRQVCAGDIAAIDAERAAAPEGACP